MRGKFTSSHAAHKHATCFESQQPSSALSARRSPRPPYLVVIKLLYSDKYCTYDRRTERTLTGRINRITVDESPQRQVSVFELQVCHDSCTVAVLGSKEERPISGVKVRGCIHIQKQREGAACCWALAPIRQ